MKMSPNFTRAQECVQTGDVATLTRLLKQTPSLATDRDETNATLLIQLIDYPGHRPNAPATAELLLQHGAAVDARRNAKNGTALTGAMCTNEPALMAVLLRFGADLEAPCGFTQGTALEFFATLMELPENAAMRKVIMKHTQTLELGSGQDEQL